MKKTMLALMAGLVFTLLACGGGASHNHDGNADHQHDSTEAHEGAAHGEGKEYTSAYVCPMHCEGSGSDTAGKCPVCEMDYVANTDHVKDGHHH